MKARRCGTSRPLWTALAALCAADCGKTQGVQALAAGQEFTCAVVVGGVQCWGKESELWSIDGGISDDGGSSAAPVAVPGLASGAVAVAAGYGYACAAVDGAAQCWGNVYLPPSFLGPSPSEVLGLGSGVQALAGGWYHACAVVDGGAQCWGPNADGQLGDGSNLDSYMVAVAVQGLGSGVQALAAGFAHTCAAVNGAGWCWGSNASGQLGNGSTAGSGAPVAVAGLTGGVQAIAVGYAHSCALVNGGVQCWGENLYGELGNGSDAGSSTPVAVAGLGPGAGVQALSAGGWHTCALVKGGLQCWGDNESGELGVDGIVSSAVPIAVQGLGPGSGVQSVTAGIDHSCALLLDGGVQCWGSGNAVPGPVAPWAD